MTEIALPGTELLTPDRHTAFADRYHKQYAQTLAWLQRDLQEKARRRDAGRAHTPAQQRELRRMLAELTGAAQLQGAQTVLAEQLIHDGQGALYTLTTPSGVIFTGRTIDPPDRRPRAMIIGSWEFDDVPMPRIQAYLAQGLRVVVPCLAQERHSFRDHPQRRWYHFNDAELLHLFFFIVGGSLCGLEATELNTIAAHFGRDGEQALPVALDLSGRHTLPAVVAAALAPDLAPSIQPDYRVLLLDESAHLLDHQELDARVNTIWHFHTHFDALNLFGLLSPADLLFVEDAPTPSSAYSRAHAWFAGQAAQPAQLPAVTRLVAPSPLELAAAVARYLAGTDDFENHEKESTERTADQQDGEAHYRSTLESKLAFLQDLHSHAAHARAARYNHAELEPASYRQRIADSIHHVSGLPLPETADRRPRTRLIAAPPAYDLYEVVLEGVAGVETAGYLLLPRKAEPQPAIICQHGLGGRPEILAGLDNNLAGGWIYDRFAQRLAEKGYVVYVPFMNWGLAPTGARDALVKHAYPLGCSPNRFEVAQLHAIVDFLQGRPEVVGDRVAFYGLSYGGHASLWLCAQEPRLCAVVTAGHFNDWQRKLTSLELSPPLVRPTCYASVDEGYDMFNYNVLNHLDHVQLMTRYAPRPHMIENGLQDTVTPTAWVDQEFARVRELFTWLKAPGHAELEHFNGPHRVWAEGSFAFLHRHLSRDARA
jgi:hypothetical protein